MNWQKVPGCRFAGVITEIITRVVRLRAKVWTRKRTLLLNIDVKSAFRQVDVAPDQAVAFACRLKDLIIQKAHRVMIWKPVGRSAAAKEVVSHMGVAGSTGKAVYPLPPGCRVPRTQGEGERDTAWVIFFMFSSGRKTARGATR